MGNSVGSAATISRAARPYRCCRRYPPILHDAIAEDGMRTILVLAIGAAIDLAAGRSQRPALPPAAPPHAAKRVQPPDWFQQQLAAARAARRAHQPRADTVGAQKAYDDVFAHRMHAGRFGGTG